MLLADVDPSNIGAVDYEQFLEISKYLLLEINVQKYML